MASPLADQYPQQWGIFLRIAVGDGFVTRKLVVQH